MLASTSIRLKVLIMAGGRGTRFWPLSRRALPKQCIPLMGERTLLQDTVRRLEGLVEPSDILLATGREMEGPIREQLPLIPDENFLVEPRGRNTAPCIAWGAVELARRWGGETAMVVLPADHVVKDRDEFQRSLVAAAQAASETNALVTLGVQPTRPETGYGYLLVSGAVGRWGNRPFHRVQRFVEKPDRATAASYLKKGTYLWNAGMFCWTADAIRDAYREFLPRSWAAMEELAHHPDRLEELWGQFDATSVDYGVMERSRGVLTLPVSFGWSDVGAWSAFPDIMEEGEGGWLVSSHALADEAEDNIVHAPGKLVALLGVHDLVVVDTDDVLMVTRRDRAQKVSRLIDALERRGLTRYL